MQSWLRIAGIVAPCQRGEVGGVGGSAWGSVDGGAFVSVRGVVWPPHVCTECAAVEHHGRSIVEQAWCSSIEQVVWGSANAQEREGTLANAAANALRRQCISIHDAVGVIPVAKSGARPEQRGAWRLAALTGRGDQGEVTSSLQESGHSVA